jgi:hypothetical protein
MTKATTPTIMTAVGGIHASERHRMAPAMAMEIARSTMGPRVDPEGLAERHALIKASEAMAMLRISHGFKEFGRYIESDPTSQPTPPIRSRATMVRADFISPAPSASSPQ